MDFNILLRGPGLPWWALRLRWKTRNWVADTMSVPESEEAVTCVYLNRHWKLIRKKGKQSFENFVSELVDTVNHEVVHAFEPAEFVGEAGAVSFGRYAKETML